MTFQRRKNKTFCFFYSGLLGYKLYVYSINVPEMMNCLDGLNDVTPSGFAFLHLMHFYNHTIPLGFKPQLI